jgi:hypothetical protein
MDARMHVTRLIGATAPGRSSGVHPVTRRGALSPGWMLRAASDAATWGAAHDSGLAYWALLRRSGVAAQGACRPAAGARVVGRMVGVASNPARRAVARCPAVASRMHRRCPQGQSCPAALRRGAGSWGPDVLESRARARGRRPPAVASRRRRHCHGDGGRSSRSAARGEWPRRRWPAAYHALGR